MAIEAVLLDDAAVDEAIALYAAHAHYGLRYPRNSQWVRDRLGKDFFFFGLRIGGDLIAVAWAARNDDFIYFVIENDQLILRNDGAYADSGGWLIRPDYHGKGLLPLLTVTILTFWFDRIHGCGAPTLWGRMMGRKDEDGDPLFWKRIGEKLTGFSYHEFLELPFGAMEKIIWEHWPRTPIYLKDLPKDVLNEALGSSFGPLVKPKETLLRWGLREITDRYVPTSLNHFVCATTDSFYRCVPNPEEFLVKMIAENRSRL